MLGTIVNTVAVIVGGFLGILFKKGISKRFEDAAFKILGLAITIIGFNGVIGAMFKVTEEGKLSESGSLLLLVSLVVGGLVGEFIDIDKRFNNFGLKIEAKFKSEGFAKGFVAASLLFCIGAMSIVGALQDGLKGDSSILYIKSLLDFISALVLTATLGYGVLFAAVTIFVYQGAISVLAQYISPILTDSMISSISMVGFAMIICLGLNFLCDTKLKTANLLPSLVIPIVYNLLIMLKTL